MPEVPQTSCPLQDAFGRTIDYLRISVTDKCNLRCEYCMPEEGVPHLRHEEVLSFEEMFEITRVAAGKGIVKVRLTGGEPLVRRGIVSLVAMLASIDGIRDYALTTNGILLAQLAPPLAEAGLHRVNVSLDTLDPDRFAQLTHGGDLRRVIEGIEAAQAAGLTPVKLNCVVRQSPDEADAQTVATFAKHKGLEVRFIRRMNLRIGEFFTVIGGSGGDCPRCNRLRLSCDGMIRPCLFNDLAFSVRDLGTEEAIHRAVSAKPESGQSSQAHFHRIGG
ncbi:MAG: radical SAM protein [Nitrospiraceae bacterium]|nr:radical SAM protein [Nitrospiraceae bacterium]